MRRISFFALLLIALLSIRLEAQSEITVVHRTPSADATSINSTTTITVVFSAPVVPLTGSADVAALPDPVRITPEISGSGEWLNTAVWRFTPDAPLPVNTTVTVSTDETFTAADGSSLAADQWQFATSLAHVSYVQVSRADDNWRRSNDRPLEREDSLLIRFSQALDPANANHFISLLDPAGASVPITITWRSPSEAIIDPVNQLEIGSEYTLSVAAVMNGQRLLDTPFTQLFRTKPLPAVSQVSPSPDSNIRIDNFGAASISFVTAMNPNSLEGRIRVEPEHVSWVPQTDPNDPYRLGVDFEPELGQTYTITLLAGAEDVEGNRITTDYSWSFTVVETPPPPLSAYLALRSESFTVTNAYREQTRVAMVTHGAEDFTSGFALYRAGDISAALHAADANTEENVYPPGLVGGLFEEAIPLRSWQQTFNGGGSRSVTEILLASEEGGQLEPGLYMLTADEYRQYGESKVVKRHLILAVSTAIITVRHSNLETLVWLTDMQSGLPVGGATVTLYARDGAMSRAETDQDGIARISNVITVDPNCQPDYCRTRDHAVITAEGEGIYAAWQSDSWFLNEDHVGNLYTDRRVYRPGDIVYFRGVLREKDDMTYSIPEVSHVDVYLCQYGCTADEALQTLRVPIRYWGTINGSFTLPETLEPSQYQLAVDWGQRAFTVFECYSYTYEEPYCYDARSNGTQITVATFDTPEFEMSATPVAEEGVQGEPLGVMVNARLYSGSPLREATVGWSVSASSAAFRHADYSFSDSAIEYWRANYFAENGPDTSFPLITTDADGAAMIPTEHIVSSTPLHVSMSVTVGEGGEAHGDRVSFFLHSTTAYVGLRHDGAIVEQGNDVTVDVISVSPAHEIVPDQPIEYSIEHLRREERPGDQYGYYFWETVVTPVMTGEVVTGSDGHGEITFRAEADGRYRIRAVTEDKQGRSHSSTIEVRVGDEPMPSFQVPTYDDKPFTITYNKDVYEPGDSARLEIQMPGQGMLLLTVQRKTVQRVFVLKIGSSEPIEFVLPVGYEDAPNVYVSGTFVQGMLSPDDSPSYASASVNLTVQPLHRQLNVEVSASSAEVSPGDTVTFDVRVTDQRGIPIRAEIGMALVDEAILSLAPAASPRLMHTFYSPQRNQVFSSTSLRGLVDDLTDRLDPPDMGGGGGGGDIGGLAASVDPREDYEISPLWLPDVVTDEDGRASVSIVMPDNLTRWRLDVRAASLSTLVGQAETSITSSLPFFVRPQTPRFLVAGDTVELAIIAHNETDQAQTVTAAIEANGVTLHEDAKRTVTFPAHSQQRIAWTAQVEDADAVDVTFFAGNEVVQDAARPALPDSQIPVLTYIAPDTVATAGVLDGEGERTESVKTTDDAIASELQVSLASSLFDIAAAALDTYPQERHETVDRLIARLMINTALHSTGRYDPLAAEIERDIQTLDELQSQYGWGWSWTGTYASYDVYMTGYAIVALNEAADAGFSSADTLLATACEGVEQSAYYPALGATSEDASFNMRAFQLYFHSLCGYRNPEVIDNLYSFRERLSPAARGLLLGLLEQEGVVSLTLRNDLWSDAIITGTGVHWEGQYGALWDTDTLTTAIILRMLTENDANEELVANAVRWLTIARRGDRWNTPLETGWGVATLVEYAGAAARQNPDYMLSLSLDGETAFGPAQAAGLSERIVLPLTGDNHQLSLERSAGSGTLYYTAALHTTLDAASAEPISRGITVLREYLDADGEPIESASLGQSVFVRLTVVASQDILYFVLDDALPAGLIADDPSLIQSTMSGISVSRSLNSNDQRWFYGSSAFSRSVFTDTRVLFYANMLPRGTYIVTYEARAGAAGAFQTMPAYAYAAAMPDIFGRSAGHIFTISADR